MAFELLSQLEASRLRKEKLLRSREVTSPILVFGIICLVIGIFLLSTLGQMMIGEGSSSTTYSLGTVVTNGYIVCASVGCITGLIGGMLLIMGLLRVAKYYRNVEADELEYQKLRTQFLSSVQGIITR